ncbi:unnamed protein product [Pylaiella littoralis]
MLCCTPNRVRVSPDLVLVGSKKEFKLEGHACPCDLQSLHQNHESVVLRWPRNNPVRLPPGKITSRIHPRLRPCVCLPSTCGPLKNKHESTLALSLGADD